MANLPATTDKSSPPTREERFLDGIAEQIANGKRPDQIAREIHPHDRKARGQLRRKIWKMVWYDVNLANRIATRAKGEMLLGMVPATQALVARAGRGRPDAVKLLYEASGFHNPKVKHDHSGEIRVKLDMPRPNFEEPVDAEVVED